MLINLRNAMMTDKRLPYDAEVEYLATTGTQYIRTGVVPNGLNKFRFDAVIPLSGGNGRVVFSVDNGSTGRNGVCLGMYNNNIIFGYKDGYSFVYQPMNIKRSYVIDGGELYIDGVLALDRGTSNIQNNYELILFTYNRNGSVFLVSGEVMIYNFEAYDENDNLVRDYVPVRVGTVGYMYDRVSGALFGNAGTGDFVLGPDKN